MNFSDSIDALVRRGEYWGNMDEKLLEEYLVRIGLPGPPPSTEQGLFLLHKSQAFAIPFENVSVFVNDPISLEPAALVEKMVRHKRGGYCFELNGLFTWALKQLGFDPEIYLARVQVHNPEPGPLTHQLLVVQLGLHRWLCDLGFGGPGLHHPMPFELNRVESQGGDDFRLSKNEDFGFCFEHKQPDGSWLPRYHFHLNRVLPVDITMANYFTSTWSGSIFRKWIMCAKPTLQGKITLYNQDFKRRANGEVSAETVASGLALLKLMREQFGIEFDKNCSERLVKEFDSRMEKK